MRRSLVSSKLGEWIKRYLLAELFAIAGALLGGLFAHFLFHNVLATALTATWGENVGYYAKVLSSDLKKVKLKHSRISFPAFFKVLRNIFIEFGPSEYLDSFIIRPIAIFLPPVSGESSPGFIPWKN